MEEARVMKLLSDFSNDFSKDRFCTQGFTSFLEAAIQEFSEEWLPWECSKNFHENISSGVCTACNFIKNRNLSHALSAILPLLNNMACIY